MITREPMLDMFIFETTEMVDQLQQLMMESEKAKKFSSSSINEIFRIMHTIKGSSGMMMFDNISHLSHAIEDMFYFIRENKPENIDYTTLSDIVLESGDLIREETERINDNLDADTDFTDIMEKAEKFLGELKQQNGFTEDNAAVQRSVSEQIGKFYITNDKTNAEYNYYFATLFFEENSEMENIRSFTVIHKLKEIAEILNHEPEDILSTEAAELIKQNGFKMYFQTVKDKAEIEAFLDDTIFLDHFDLVVFDSEASMMRDFMKEEPEIVCETELEAELEPEVQPVLDFVIHEEPEKLLKHEDPLIDNQVKQSHKSSLISVDVNKLDILMDLVGELVISESMVTNSPALEDIKTDNFFKAVRQHRKHITDLQDAVMSIRMVSLGPTLTKMNRIVRDMCKKLTKKAELVIIGEDTEVDKNIIEHIGDPLMHIIRNSMDHGIETEEIRTAKGKNAAGIITIEAKNTGGDVVITIKDDGKGLNKDKIRQRAIENGVIEGDGMNLTDREIYATIFSPGLSTKEEVTEFSGRGVGMDVVVKEIEKVRGNVTVDSALDEGTTVTIKIPLTLAILNGMMVKVGESIFTIPVTSIQQSIIVKQEEVIKDLDNKEILTLRGEFFPIIRLHELYKLKTNITQIEEGIVVMVEEDGKSICLFADELLGEQQVVIKAMPEYINSVKGTSGCTLLGNGSISLILDVAQLVNM